MFPSCAAAAKQKATCYARRLSLIMLYPNFLLNLNQDV